MVRVSVDWKKIVRRRWDNPDGEDLQFVCDLSNKNSKNKQNDSNKWNQKLFWKSSCVFYTFEPITDAGFFSHPACCSHQHYGTHVVGEAHGSAVYIHHGCTLQWDQSKQYFWIFQIQIKDLSFLAIASSWLHSCLLLPARAAPSPPTWLMPEASLWPTLQITAGPHQCDISYSII